MGTESLSSPGFTNESPPPPSDNADSSPPPPSDSDSSSSSPPPPDSGSGDTSSPPPPADSNSSPSPPTPPPPDSESPPPPDQGSSSSAPPPPEENSSPSPPPPQNSPSPKNSPSPPSDRTPADPPPENSSSGNPPPPSASEGEPPVRNWPPMFSPPAGRTPGRGGIDGSPPPPPSGRLSPPARHSTSGGSREVSPTTTSSSSGSVNAGVIAAAAVIVVGILAAIVICLVCAARKKKRRRYYMDTPGSTRAKGDYYNGSNWNTPQNLRPPPGIMNTTPGGIPTWAPPPLPIGGHTSSEYSYSGGAPHANPTTPSPNMALSNQSSFSYEELAQATRGFSQDNLLGQGGFGYVHKGVLSSGKEVAVKSLKSGSGQGEREFQAEVEIISRVHHRHLVSLVGYCIADGQRMLVYEFVSNKTLEFHLHGNDRPTMDWPSRMRIALGAAKGLGYLHEDCHPRIIHRDIKAANILIDDNFEAMVADFGLAKLTSDTYTHVSTRVMGTFGYMAPEYASSGKLTDKSDVFSFGVMMLELITGRKPIDLSNKTMDDSLVDWARPILGRVLDNGNYEEIVDPRLGNNFDPHEMDRMIACAAASIRHSARKRPKMSQIARSLEGDQSSLDDTAIRSGQTPETTTYDTTAYNADMMKFKKMVMNGNGYGSSEFEQTSEYGLNPSSSSSDLGSREHKNSGAQRQRL